MPTTIRINEEQLARLVRIVTEEFDSECDAILSEEPIESRIAESPEDDGSDIDGSEENEAEFRRVINKIFGRKPKEDDDKDDCKDKDD